MPALHEQLGTYRNGLLRLVFDPEFLCFIIQDLLWYARGVLTCACQQSPQLLGEQMQDPASAHCTSATFTEAAHMPTMFRDIQSNHICTCMQCLNIDWMQAAARKIMHMTLLCKGCKFHMARWQVQASSGLTQANDCTLTNKLVFFSRKPVRAICNSFGSKFCTTFTVSIQQAVLMCTYQSHN